MIGEISPSTKSVESGFLRSTIGSTSPAPDGAGVADEVVSAVREFATHPLRVTQPTITNTATATEIRRW
ncbi:hypothetical protein JF66_21320 [Cryobacterium sp. MLB-32]|nr:hypothetical protein JF66_21320 [Cryobacterium sp. MLB-32]